MVDRPGAKYRDTDGIAALVAVAYVMPRFFAPLFWLTTTPSTDETFKSSSYLTDASYHLPDARSKTRDPGMAGFSLAFGCPGVPIFSWLAEGDSAGNSPITPQMRMERFAKAMHGNNALAGNVVNGTRTAAGCLDTKSNHSP